MSGGTNRILDVWKARQQGVRVIQRLAQGNWVHKARFISINHTFRSVRNNYLLAFIRRFMTDAVIYQSEFVKNYWTQEFGRVESEEFVIYNGVDLSSFSSGEKDDCPVDHIRIIVVEGKYGEGNQVYLEMAINFAERLEKVLSKKIELVIVGEVPIALQEKYSNLSRIWITWKGIVERDSIPAINRNGHLFFAVELNAGCPNSVIEAMACGLPVVGFETGSLPELVRDGAGEIVPYGADHWRLEPPDIDHLVSAAVRIINNQGQYRMAARKRAVAAYDVYAMADKYLTVMGWNSSRGSNPAETARHL
jgi:glycosyltransferase involved in cell wall biosynthesis